MEDLHETLMFNFELFNDIKTVIVGLSGGPDSVCLLHLLVNYTNQKKLTVIAAHLNHEWRKSSNKDVQFCKNICKKLQIPIVIRNISELNFIPKKDGSKESEARQYRRFFLQSVAKKNNADAIALGHHQEDQIETFFIRLFRGSSITGLAGIKEKNGLFVRPLLHTQKSEIINYLKTHKIAFLTDPTNTCNTFLRNKIRNILLPEVKKLEPRSSKTISNTMQQLQEADEFLEAITENTYSKISHNNVLDCKKLFAHPIFLQKKIIIYWLIKSKAPFTLTSKMVLEVIRFLKSPCSGSHILGNWKIIKKQQKAFIKIMK